MYRSTRKMLISTQNALAIFFPFYVAIEVPSNMMMKGTRPALWIPFIMVCWGICTTLMGLVKKYPGLMAARAALGIAEGGLFPGGKSSYYFLQRRVSNA